MSEVLENYNEIDAAAFIYKHISKSMKEIYSANDISYILDLVYEYYETIEHEVPDGINDAEGVNDLIDAPRMLAFVNNGLESSKKELLTQIALEEILMLDNDYMDSIDDDFNFDEFVEDVYGKLSDDVKKKYSIEDVYLMLGFEADYIDEIADDSDLDEEALRCYIVNSAAEEELEVDRESLDKILEIEEKLLAEY